jgi:hypothetical protein
MVRRRKAVLLRSAMMSCRRSPMRSRTSLKRAVDAAEAASARASVSVSNVLLAVLGVVVAGVEVVGAAGAVGVDGLKVRVPQGAVRASCCRWAVPRKCLLRSLSRESASVSQSCQ